MNIRRICTIATVLALTAAIGVPSLIAQITDLRVQIPFEFYAAGKLLPAGTYILSKPNPTTLRLRDEKGHAVFVSAGHAAANMGDDSWIVLSKYGNRSFFRGAYWAGSGTSLRVPETRAEQEAARVAGQPVGIRIAAK